MAREKKKDEGPAGAPAWVVTYGDLMSLLLTFFVLLLSFATITEVEAFKEVVASFTGSLGFLPRELTITQVNPLPKRMKRPRKTDEDAARRIRRAMQVIGEEHRIDVDYDGEGGLRISLPSPTSFTSGSAVLRPDVFPLLAALGRMFADLPDAVRFEVRGHTDKTPLANNPEFRDNHDLSYARADAVARRLATAGGMTMDRFEVIAAGSGHPIEPNTTSEGREANRRVEIQLKGPLDRVLIQGIQSQTQELTNPS